MIVMPAYVRVKVLATKHVIDIPQAKAALHPDRYEVIDQVPVGAPRPAEMYVPKPKAPKPEPVEAPEPVSEETVIPGDGRFGQG